MKATKPRKAGLMNKEVFKNNTISKGPDMSRDARKTRSDGNSVPVSKSTIKKKAPIPKHLLGEKMDKKKPENKKKRYRAKVTMTSMKNKYF